MYPWQKRIKEGQILLQLGPSQEAKSYPVLPF